MVESKDLIDTKYMCFDNLGFDEFIGRLMDTFQFHSIFPHYEPRKPMPFESYQYLIIFLYQCSLTFQHIMNLLYNSKIRNYPSTLPRLTRVPPTKLILYNWLLIKFQIRLGRLIGQICISVYRSCQEPKIVPWLHLESEV